MLTPELFTIALPTNPFLCSAQNNILEEFCKNVCQNISGKIEQ